MTGACGKRRVEQDEYVISPNKHPKKIIQQALKRCQPTVAITFAISNPNREDDELLNEPELVKDKIAAQAKSLLRTMTLI
jgi:hypothetical protein